MPTQPLNLYRLRSLAYPDEGDCQREELARETLAGVELVSEVLGSKALVTGAFDT